MTRVSLRHLLIASAAAGSLGAISAIAAAQDQAATPPPAPVHHKHIGNVKYSDFAQSSASETATAEFTETPDGPAQQVELVGLWWGKLKDAGTVYSADPMEGGQVTARYRPGRQKPGHVPVANVTPDPGAGGQVKDAGTVYSADPMEGGQIAERTYQPGKPTYGNLIGDAPVMVPEPVAKGTATFKTLAGMCAAGKHLDKVKIVLRSRGFTLHDATVVSVEPADPVDGQAMEQVTLSYASIEG